MTISFPNLLTGKLSELVHRHEAQGHSSQGHSRGHRHISEHELKNKSDRHLNIQASINYILSLPVQKSSRIIVVTWVVCIPIPVKVTLHYFFSFYMYTGFQAGSTFPTTFVFLHFPTFFFFFCAPTFLYFFF